MKNTAYLVRLLCWLCIVSLLTMLWAVPMQAESATVVHDVPGDDVCSVTGTTAQLLDPTSKQNHQDHHRHCPLCCKHTIATSSPDRIDLVLGHLVYRFSLPVTKAQGFVLRSAWLTNRPRGPPAFEA
ncbi:hypothetical protein FHW67_001524 [Herbaspirillum sp. Sphag1AN]|uniref:DUF2946 family protein n=1 Tax=unclassified Herbaspirillum TaxID=2624150 RepID=UPI00160D2E8A|nr:MULTISPECIES: DUF2946 family protein [unclassified Herbaspirillum]MBB3212244.1 hypothetical protein [Herbaspirillum sp. Sphag1AN]MBB3245658.1 hypothetical protein [Herbaspirillum sp. Sphag64]